jgi:hypothetical protein
MSFLPLTLRLMSRKEACMRCTRGDLAVITRPNVEGNLGALVEVLRPWRVRPGWWWVRSLSGPLPRNDGSCVEVATVADTALRPIQGALALQPTIDVSGL